jgi:hypothetical protein
MISRNLDVEHKDLQQFIDVATSRHAFKTKYTLYIVLNNSCIWNYFSTEYVTFSTNSTYLLDPSKYGFGSNDADTYPESQTYLAIGTSKMTQIVEGSMGQPSAAVIMGGWLAIFSKITLN